jgi:hypothetical protein
MRFCAWPGLGAALGWPLVARYPFLKTRKSAGDTFSIPELEGCLQMDLGKSVEHVVQLGMASDIRAHDDLGCFWWAQMTDSAMLAMVFASKLVLEGKYNPEVHSRSATGQGTSRYPGCWFRNGC